MTGVISWQYGCYSGTFTFRLGKNVFPDDTDFAWLDTQSYWIFEGNFSCDCNRSKIIPGFDWDIFSCGDDIIFSNVDFYRNDKYIGNGNDVDWFEWWGETGEIANALIEGYRRRVLVI